MTDNEYPFSLRGATERFRGSGRSDGEAVTSRVFTLSRGIVIVDVEPEPDPEDFVLRIVPAEGLTKEGAMAVAGGGGLAGIAAGGVIGSVVPVAGTIVGAAIGGLAGLLAAKAHDKIRPRIWEPIGFDVKLVNSDDEKDIPDYEYWGSLREGKYRLLVKTENPWRLKLIQPDLGQSYGPLSDAFEDKDWNPEGVSVFGPCDSSSRPILASIQHRGKGCSLSRH